MPAIRDKIRSGDVRGAVSDMTSLGISPGLQEWYVRSTLNPKTRLSRQQLTEFTRYASPEELQRMQHAIELEHNQSNHSQGQ